MDIKKEIEEIIRPILDSSPPRQLDPLERLNWYSDQIVDQLYNLILEDRKELLKKVVLIEDWKLGRKKIKEMLEEESQDE